MRVEQLDIAHLSDDDVRRLVALLVDVADAAGNHPVADVWRRMIVALVRAHRARRAAFDELVLDALNDDGPGALVAPGDDPITDALDALRRECRGNGV